MTDWSEEAPTIELIKATVTMPEVLELLGVEVDNSGKFRLREEDATPSVHCYDDHAYDYGQGKGYDVLDLVQELTGCTIGQAMHRIWTRALKAGKEPGDVEATKPRTLENFYDAVPWWQCEDPHMVETCRRLCPEGCSYDDLLFGRLVVPTHEGLLVPHWTSGTTDHVHGVKVRRWDGAKTAWTGSQFAHQLYELPGRSRVAWLVEGESDAWALATHYIGETGKPWIFALPAGAGTWRDSWLDDLAPFETIAVVMDNDRAGEQAREKIRLKVGYGRLKDVRVPDLLNDVREALVRGWTPPQL